ncbi:hypothetical protein E4U13_006837 [Claviceps humidiphila]|uniref:Uncharacterized protein n=1 Tax=Claviceps humidiphila TaxID=1294629 RepID=A0A9P7TT16_9HYPO|nr:hypothetical protein E4U13_006837 [Claviceps humidiphila]
MAQDIDCLALPCQSGARHLTNDGRFSQKSDSTFIATLLVLELAAMATPSTPARLRDTDGAAQYSRDTEPTSPFILQRSKRQRDANAAPVSIQLPWKVAGDDTKAQTYLGKQLDDLNQVLKHHRHEESCGSSVLPLVVPAITASVEVIKLFTQGIPAGYAIQPATKLVRDRLVADELKKELGCAFDASKVSLPEKRYTYAIQDIPFSMKLGPAEYTRNLAGVAPFAGGSSIHTVRLQWPCFPGTEGT